MFKLVQDKSGNMAIGFGVAIVPLLMAAGLMVDYSMVSNYRSTAQGAADAALSDMDYWTDSGTVMSEGLAWGWRVLSPTEPFTEGEEYGDIRKIAVLMTDGNNDVVTQQMKADDPESAPFLTHYTAYGHLRYNPRLDDDKKSIYRDYLNQRTARVCENMKAKDIELYIISFGEVSAETEAVLRKCATTPPQYYKTIKVAELSLAFGEIAAMISRPYLTK